MSAEFLTFVTSLIIHGQIKIVTLDIFMTFTNYFYIVNIVHVHKHLHNNSAEILTHFRRGAWIHFRLRAGNETFLVVTRFCGKRIIDFSNIFVG